MKKRKILKISVFLIICLVALGSYAIVSYALETNSPSQIEFDIRLNTEKTSSNNYIETTKGTYFKKYDIINNYYPLDVSKREIAVDLYLKTPKANITDFDINIVGLDYNNQTGRILKPKVGSYEINSELSSLGLQVTNYTGGFNIKFASNGTERISSDSELKIATFYFEIDSAYNSSLNKECSIKFTNNSHAERNGKSVTIDSTKYSFYTTDDVSEIAIENQTVTTNTGRNINITNYRAELNAGEIIKVTPVALKLYGSSEKYSDGILQEFTYESDNPNIVEVLADGSLKAIKSGETHINIYSKVETAQSKVLAIKVNGGNSVTSLNISNKSAFTNPINLDEEINVEVNIEPSYAIIVYKSSNESVATISQEGKIKTVGIGTAIITVTDNNGHSDTVTIQVKNPIEGIEILNPTSVVAVGGYYRIQTKTTPAGYEGRVKFKVSDSSIAKIEGGIINGVSAGSVVITAYYGDLENSFITTIAPTSTIVLTESLEITNKQKNVVVGDRYGITVKINPQNASNKLISYSSSDESIAKVDKNGNVTAIAPGNVTITASQSTASRTISDSIQLTVINTEELVPVNGIIFNEDLKFSVENLYELTIKPTPNNTTGSVKIKNITSADSTIIEVNSFNEDEAYILTRKAGNTTITVIAKDENGTEFTYSGAAVVYGVSFAEAPYVRVGEGCTYQILPLINNLPTGEEIVKTTYYSSNENVATVNENGLVNAISANGLEADVAIIRAEVTTRSGKVYKSNQLAINVSCVKIVLDDNIKELTIGEEYKPNFHLEPTSASSMLGTTYTCAQDTILQNLYDPSNPYSEGWFKALDLGEAEIVVKDNFYNISSTCKIYVVDVPHSQKEIIPAVASTCITQGHGEYEACSICHEPTVAGSDALLPLNPKNHVGATEIRNVIAATTSNPGYTGDTYCLDCNQIIRTGKIIPKIEIEDPIVPDDGAEEKPPVSEDKKPEKGEEKPSNEEKKPGNNEEKPVKTPEEIIETPLPANKKDETPKTGNIELPICAVMMTIVAGAGIIFLSKK